MMLWGKRIVLAILLFAVFALGFAAYALYAYPKPETFTYGVSFNTLYARELGLPWEAVYTAILDDLQVRNLRLAAHWPMVEPENGVWNFSELDRQIELAQEYDARVILAVGRRLPRWPECHVPAWAAELTWDEQKEELRAYLEAVVERYKANPSVVYWQVENEPFLTVYAQEHCGSLDTAFLEEEIALVHELDPTRKVLVTDSGNLGLWAGAYKRGDTFGTSVYVYLWNEDTGPLRTILPPETYLLKRKLMELLYGPKDTFLIELSAEPWLNKPITETDLETQFSRMNPEKFEEIIHYAKRTRLPQQYLWGAEWWYWLKETQNEPAMWERARVLYGGEA